VLVIAAVVRLRWWDFHLDDAYITYSYARALAAGEGFSFNGAHVLGTTSPLYALALVPPLWLGIPITTAAKGIGLLGSLAGCALLYGLVRSSVGLVGALLAAALLALNGVHASMSMSGMETGLYTSVCLAALLAQRAKREQLAAALAAVSCLLRPDGLLLALVLGLVHLQEGRKLRVRPLVWFAAPLLAWLVFATLAFGTPVPASLTAKLAYHDYGAFTLSAALSALGARLWPMLAGAAALGLLAVYGRARPLLPLMAWTGLYLLAFTRAPNFSWYYAPALPGLMALAVAGLLELTGHASSRPALLARPLVRAALAALCLAALLFVAALDLQDQRRFVERTHGPDVTGTYRALGEWLAANTPEGARVATPEVGYIAFYSRRPILDLAGLCSPQVVPYLRSRDYPAIVRDYQPDYVALTLEGRRPIHNAITASPWFQQHYGERVRFPYRGSAYAVWSRRNQREVME
jgi:hypothetical protein